MTQIGRRKIDPNIHSYSKLEETINYLIRALILGGLSWLIWTTNNNTAALALLEWRVMQLEFAVHIQKDSK